MSAVSTLKALVRDTCGLALSMTRVTAPSVRLGQRLSVVTFHRVLTEPQRRLYPLPGLAVTPDELDDHLRFLTRHFQCQSLDAALGLWKQGRIASRPLLAIAGAAAAALPAFMVGPASPAGPSKPWASTSI